MSQIQIKRSVITQQVQEGMKRKELSEYYGLPESQIAKVLKQLGLKIRKFHTPKFEIIEDEKDILNATPEDFNIPITQEELENIDVNAEYIESNESNEEEILEQTNQLENNFSW